MRHRNSSTNLLMFILILLFPLSSFAYNFPFSESSFLEFKADLTYTAKVRTADPNPELVTESKGNSNYEKGDFVNNKGIARLEIKFDSTYLTLFANGDAAYDYVMDDKNLERSDSGYYHFEDANEKYPEGTDIDEAKKHAARRIEPQEYYLDFHVDKFTLRAGRQIVQWGELTGSIAAPGVDVLNILDSSRFGAGYEPRDMKVPGLMVWTTLEVTAGLSVEGVYAPDFDPRYSVPVVGTFGSFVDLMGFGSPDKFEYLPGQYMPYVDGRPTKFKDMQQYGGAIRKIFPSLANFETGLYYFHYFDWKPLLSIDTSVRSSYGELDMYGMSLSQYISALDFSFNAELAYRPNQSQLMVAEEDHLPNLGTPNGIEKTRTLNWGFGGMGMISDLLSFTPWVVGLRPMFELSGGNNLDYRIIYYNKDGVEEFFAIPEHTAYYMVALSFENSDMIDNTKLTLTLMGRGNLHKEERSVHMFGPSLKAVYGDNLSIMIGYDYIIGNIHETHMTSVAPDRNAFTGAITYGFM